MSKFTNQLNIYTRFLIQRVWQARHKLSFQMPYKQQIRKLWTIT